MYELSLIYIPWHIEVVSLLDDLVDIENFDMSQDDARGRNQWR